MRTDEEVERGVFIFIALRASMMPDSWHSIPDPCERDRASPESERERERWGTEHSVFCYAVSAVFTFARLTDD